ncbi:MAG: c-type cytochrome domain-containing protein, partial [Opitutaceae bacterium]
MTPPLRVRMSRRLHVSQVLAALLAAVSPATAAEPVAPVAREAMLILKGECFPCHNERKRKGGLVLTSREALLRGNESGPAAEAGRPDESAIARVIAHDADPQMPPDRPLTDAQRKTLRDWIASGLPWDDAALTTDEQRPVQLATLPDGYHPVLALALSHDGKRLAVGRGGEIVIHDTTAKDFPEVGRAADAGDAVQALAWSADGRWLASGGFRRVILRDAASLAVAREISNGLAGRVTALRFSPDSRQLALADGVTGRSGIVRLIDTAGGRATAAWTAHDDTVFALDFTRDGARLATAGGDRLVKIWDPATHAEVARLEGHGAPVHAVAFNADGTQLASGGADRELNIWDTTTREKIISLGAPASAVNAVCWPGDGAKLFAA